MACLYACRSTPRAFRAQGWQVLRASSTATKAAPAKTASPEHHAAEPHVIGKTGHHDIHHYTVHHAVGTTGVATFHFKPEIRMAQVLKMGREVVPKMMATTSGHGAWGLPGPRSIFMEDEETKLYTSMNFWESKEAMEKFEKSEEQQKLMQDVGAFIDIKSMTHAAHSSDFIYYAPIKPCNFERYPVAVMTFKVKPGFRQVCQKLVTSNSDVARWTHDIGLLFQVITYNEAEDEATSYNVYKDLLKYTEGQTHMEKNLADWGIAEYIDWELPHKEGGAHDAHKDAAHHEDPTKVHSNSWVYSE